MNSKAYKTAIIGCGRVGWLLNKDPLIPHKPCTHAGAYSDIARTDLSAAADINPKRLNAFAQEYGIEGAYPDYREMLEKEKPEIVSVCAYAPDRFSMVKDSVERGVKGIWCEKAIATSLTEADEMIRLCDESNTKMIVSHMRRWNT
ncbi:MAG: Gfo/Idh/MocA family oxidoreductase, partial [Thermodesulfovibrionia bacterium]|nr:Gfo/Idh/MocA family oxidoreductase [Thermodesulfovibrionia bacterium]